MGSTRVGVSVRRRRDGGAGAGGRAKRMTEVISVLLLGKLIENPTSRCGFLKAGLSIYSPAVPA